MPIHGTGGSRWVEWTAAGAGTFAILVHVTLALLLGGAALARWLPGLLIGLILIVGSAISGLLRRHLRGTLTPSTEDPQREDRDDR